MSEDDPQHILRSPLPTEPYPQVSLGEYLSGRIGGHDPESIAFLNTTSPTDDHLTYGQLHRRCQQLARSLTDRHSITATDVVALFADNTVDHAVAMFGTVYLGVTFVPVPPAHGPYELASQMALCSVTVLAVSTAKLPVLAKLLARPEYAASVEQLKLVIVLDTGVVDREPPALLQSHPLTARITHTLDRIIDQSGGQLLDRIPHHQVALTDRYLICFTSGSTGAPKGAIHSHRSVMAMWRNCRWPPECGGRRIAIPFPLGHISGCLFVPTALDCGMTVALMHNTDPTDSVMERIARHRIQHLILSMGVCADLASVDYRARFDLSCLRQFCYAGSKISASLLRTVRARYGVEMFELYGATEFLGQVNSAVAAPELLRDQFEPGNLGPVMAGVQCKVVNPETGQAVVAGENGELCFRGQSCFVGYLNNEEATRQTVDGDGWYHSGDVGHYDRRGHLFITDRLKELVKFRGWSIAPAEIEQYLHRHEAVAAVCVVGVAHVTDSALIRAYVLCAPGKVVGERELCDFVKENLGFQKRLRAGVRFIDQMPRTSVGKIDRQHFKRLVQDELISEPVE